MAGMRGLLCLVLLTWAVSPALSKRVLLVTVSVGSHLLQANSLAEGLLDRGHQVAVLWNVQGTFSEDMMNPKVELIRFDTGFVPVLQTEEYERKLLSMELENADTFSVLEELMVNDTVECKRILGNKELEAAVASRRFDFAVIDGIFRCLVIIPYRLGTPFSFFSAFLPMDGPHAALQAQFLIRTQLDSMLTDKDSFFSKLYKVLVIAVLTEPDSYREFSNETIAMISSQYELWLLDITRVLDVPIPFSPNVIHVGGLNIRQPKPMKAGALRTFVDSSSNGVILVSFGTYARYIPERITTILLETFTGLEYSFVWKLKEASLKPGQKLPENVMILDWLPQNDLLGHRNVKLFITHCGNSGRHEALHNHVPMLGIPLFGDQIFNAKHLVTLKMGNYLRAKDLTKEKLTIMIREIIGSNVYRDSITKASKIFRDQPMSPKDTAAYWIDHVMTHGAEHLKSVTNDMPWYQILMFDVLLVVVVVILTLVVLLYLVCCCIYRRCCRSADKVKTS